MYSISVNNKLIGEDICNFNIISKVTQKKHNNGANHSVFRTVTTEPSTDKKNGVKTQSNKRSSAIGAAARGGPHIANQNDINMRRRGGGRVPGGQGAPKPKNVSTYPSNIPSPRQYSPPVSTPNRNGSYGSSGSSRPPSPSYGGSSFGSTGQVPHGGPNITNQNDKNMRRRGGGRRPDVVRRSVSPVGRSPSPTRYSPPPPSQTSNFSSSSSFGAGTTHGGPNITNQNDINMKRRGGGRRPDVVRRSVSPVGRSPSPTRYSPPPPASGQASNFSSSSSFGAGTTHGGPNITNQNDINMKRRGGGRRPDVVRRSVSPVGRSPSPTRYSPPPPSQTSNFSSSSSFGSSTTHGGPNITNQNDINMKRRGGGRRPDVVRRSVSPVGRSPSPTRYSPPPAASGQASNFSSSSSFGGSTTHGGPNISNQNDVNMRRRGGGRKPDVVRRSASPVGRSPSPVSYRPPTSTNNVPSNTSYGNSYGGSSYGSNSYSSSYGSPGGVGGSNIAKQNNISMRRRGGGGRRGSGTNSPPPKAVATPSASVAPPPRASPPPPLINPLSNPLNNPFGTSFETDIGGGTAVAMPPPVTVPDEIDVGGKLTPEGWMDQFSSFGDRRSDAPFPLPKVMAAKRVVLVRHGQSTWNAEGRMQGSSNSSKLTAHGKKQAETTKTMLSDVDFDMVVQSPLKRASETTDVIWNGRKESIVVLPHLREIDLYSFQGLLREQSEEMYRDKYNKWRNEAHNFEIDSHSPVKELWYRASLVWQKILKSDDSNPGKILVVAHNAINQALVCSALGLSTEYFRRFLQSNAATTILDFIPNFSGPPKVTIERLNQSPYPPFSPDSASPSVRSRIILVRQGGTDDCFQGIMSGLNDSPCNKIGVVNAEKTGKLLQDLKCDQIISSPLQRAHSTAEAIAKYQASRGQNPPSITVWDDLKDWDCGEWAMKPVGQIRNQSLPESAEAPAAFWKRCEKVWHKILDLAKMKDGNIVLCAHSMVIAGLVGLSLGQDKSALSLTKHDPGSVTIIDFPDDLNDDKCVLRCINYSAHLEQWTVPIGYDNSELVCGIDGCF